MGDLLRWVVAVGVAPLRFWMRIILFWIGGYSRFQVSGSEAGVRRPTGGGFFHCAGYLPNNGGQGKNWSGPVIELGS
jgi:hypothetical protein